MTEFACDSILLNDLQAQNEAISEELTEAVADAASAAQFVDSPAVETFAEELANHCGVAHAVPCKSGPEALRLAILGVLGEGDGEAEIVTVSHTFPATLEAIIAARYKPVLVDVDPETCLMDLECVEAAWTKRTVAVVPVYTYGQMLDIVRLRKWTEARGAAVIEDAAHAIGAAFDGVGPGVMSDAAAFSFHPASNLGAWGEAGSVVCRDHGIAKRIAQYVNHGRSYQFTHVRIGCCGRMDAIQAAVLRVKLRYVDEWNKARQRVAGWYAELLGRASLRNNESAFLAQNNSEGAWSSTPPEWRRKRQDSAVLAPQAAPGAYHVFNQYVIQSADRDRVRAALRVAGVATGIHYPIPSHEQPAYHYLGFRPDDLPVTHRLCKRILSLPMFPQVARGQVERVVESGWPAATAVIG